MDIKELDSELPKDVQTLVDFHNHLLELISKSLGIPKKYFNERNTNEKEI